MEMSAVPSRSGTTTLNRGKQRSSLCRRGPMYYPRFGSLQSDAQCAYTDCVVPCSSSRTLACNRGRCCRYGIRVVMPQWLPCCKFVTIRPLFLFCPQSMSRLFRKFRCFPLESSVDRHEYLFMAAGRSEDPVSGGGPDNAIGGLSAYRLGHRQTSSPGACHTKPQPPSVDSSEPIFLNSMPFSASCWRSLLIARVLYDLGRGRVQRTLWVRFPSI